MDSKNSDDTDDTNDTNDTNGPNDFNDINENIEKPNSCKGVIIAFVCISIILIIIYFIVIHVVPKKGVFQPMTKCTTCPDALLTCQSATENGSVCNWCRFHSKGTNTRASACGYGYTHSGNNQFAGNVVPAAWDVKHKKYRTKKYKEYTVVTKYKIPSVHHPNGDAYGWRCVPTNAICENCTSIVPLNKNKCKNMAKDRDK